MDINLLGYEISIKRARKKEIYLPSLAQNIRVEENKLVYEFPEGTPHYMKFNAKQLRLEGIQSHFSDTQKRVYLTKLS